MLLVPEADVLDADGNPVLVDGRPLKVRVTVDPEKVERAIGDFSRALAALVVDLVRRHLRSRTDDRGGAPSADSDE